MPTSSEPGEELVAENRGRRPGPARWRVVAVVAIFMLAADLALPPRLQLSNRVLIAAIHVYRATLSRGLQLGGVRCRFSPSCSHFAEACLREHGTIRGCWLAAGRVVRCGPWTEAGTVDPPPLPDREPH